MLPDDPRHGTVAGYGARCRCAACKRAIAAYNQRRKLFISRGQPTHSFISAVGSRRRLQALGALGWSVARIAEQASVDRTYLTYIMRTDQRITVAKANAIAAVYDRLCMTPAPAANRHEAQGVTATLRRAERLGWAPPLAWDCIDTDSEPHVGAPSVAVDEVLVQRILGGDASSASSATRAERTAVRKKWTGTKAELERLTGWNVHRDRRKDAA